MREASNVILNGFELETDVKVVTYPNRYMDEDRSHVLELSDGADQ